MKKNLFVISIFVFILSFSSVFAFNHIAVSPQKVMVNGEQKNFEVYNIDGNNFFKLRDIAFILNNTTSQFSVDYNTEKRMIEIFKGKQYSSVGGELNTGTDKSNMAVKSSQKLSIDNVEKDLLAYNIGGNNFFKLRELGLELDFNVDFDSTNNMVLIESKKVDQVANITDVVSKIFDGIMYVEITTDTPINSYNTFSLSEPDRIILDISNSNLKINTNEINVNYGGITKVRMGNQGNNLNRIVIDLEKSSDYKVVQSVDQKTTCLALSKTLAFDDLIKTPDKVLLVYNGSIISIPNNQTPEIIESGENDNELTEEQLNNRAKITSIKYSATNNKLKITGSKTIECESFILDNPYRLIVDIKNSVLDVEGPTTITPNNKNISAIRFSQKEIDVVRVVFDLQKEFEYKINENGTTIEVELEELNINRVNYEISKNYATLTLYNVTKSVFTTTESSKNNTYTLKYSTSKFNPKTDDIDIYDDFVDNIKITSGKIVISGVGNTTYSMKKDGDNVVITMKLENSNSKDDFVVLLDAGHGGTDPGACNGTDYEKVYNLAIMLKLKEMLEDTDGITVYASRTTDKYIDREGRLDFATGYEDADLFVSIHNNSSSNKKYSGTMVLYYDNEYEKDYGITSKEFAKIVLENLVSDLETRSWGTVSRDDLWVLYYSELPSILCEVSFISNDEEVARLRTEEFQETAARAIYNGIMEAKEQMER